MNLMQAIVGVLNQVDSQAERKMEEDLFASMSKQAEEFFRRYNNVK